MSLRLAAVLAAVVVVVGILENTFFGADSGGFKHHLSVAFFFATVLGLVALVVIGVLALVRLARRRA